MQHLEDNLTSASQHQLHQAPGRRHVAYSLEWEKKS